MKREIKTTLALDGEKAYKAGLEDINRELRVLGSEMKATTSAYGANQSSVEALAAKQGALNKLIDQQRVKVASLRQAVQEAADKYGEADKKTDGYRIQLNNAQVALNQMEADLKKTNVTSATFAERMADSSKKLKDLGGKISDAGKTLTMGLTLPVMGAVAAIGALVNKSLENADALQTMAEVTGLSTERLQELKYVGTKVDVELESMTGSQRFLTKAMDAAAKGTKAQADIFRELGVSATDSNGSLRDSNVVFGEAIDALGRMTNPTERDAMALKLFGKSALELNPLIKAGSAEIARLTEEAHKNGAVMSGESVEAMDKFKDSMDAWKLTLTAAAGNMTASLLPSLQSLAKVFVEKGIPAIKGLVEGIANLVKGFANLPGWVKTVIGALGALAVGIGPVITGLGGVFSAISSIKAALPGLISFFTGPGGIVLLVAAAAATLIAFATAESDAHKEADALGAAIEDTNKSFKDQTTKIQDTSALASSLSDELYNLSGKEKLTNDEKVRMALLVGQLNKLMPELSLKIDEQTGKLNLNKEAITDYIDVMKQKAELDAYQATLTDLYTKRIEVMRQLEDATKAYNIVSEQNPGSAFMTQEFEAWDKALQNRDDLEKLIADIQAAYTEKAKVIMGSNDAIIQSEGDVSRSITASGETMKQWDARMTERTQEITARLQEIESEAQRHEQQMGDIDQRGIERTKLTAKQIKANLWQQVLDMRAWHADMAKVAKRVPEDVAKELEALGPKMAPVIKELSTMSDKDLAAWVGVWQAKGKEAAGAAKAPFDGLPGDIEGIGNEVAAGFAKGMKDKIAVIQGAATALGKAAHDTLTKYAEVSSPSKLFKRIGGYFGEGLALGIEGMAGRVAAASSFMSRAAVVGMSRAPLPALAGAGGGYAAPTTNNNTKNINISVVVPGVSVRSDADIKAITQGIASETTKQLRAQGVG